MKKSIKYLAIVFFFCMLASCSDDDDGQNVGPIVFPTFSQPAGTYNNPIEVEISSNVEGADIYYTTDGTLPSSGSTRYSGPITISNNTDLKAIAISDTNGEAQIGGVSYNFKTATPGASVEGGNIEFSQYVKLSADTEGSTIYYTLDGSDPTEESMVYDPANDSIWVDVEFDELKAIALSNFEKSDIFSVDYSIVLEALSTIYWYAAEDDQVTGLGGSNPFLPYDQAINNYEITLNTNTVLDTVPLGHDVIVMADTYSANFDLSDFQGKVIVTYSRSVETFMSDIIERDTEGEMWNYSLLTGLTWVNPEDWGSETVMAGSSLLMTDIMDDEAAGVSFVKREDVIQGTISASDAVIVYEVTKGDKQWYWVHVGAFNANDPARASEILKYVLDTLTGN